MEPRRIELVLCFFAALIFGGDGFKLYWSEMSPSSEQLQCSVNATSSSLDISTVIGLTIYDITHHKVPVKLASISAFESELYIDHVCKSSIDVFGSISLHNAELVVNFSNETSCSDCSYSCEVSFVNSSGYPIVRQKALKSTRTEMEDSCSAINTGMTNQMIDAADRLAKIADKLEKEMDKMTENSCTKASENKRECYKGMASLTLPPRIPITVLGNKTALCDTMTDGGGWIVVQRRINGKVDFYRNWAEYRAGFGDVTPDGEYWLGNDALHNLTWMGTFELRIDLVHQGKKHYALYSNFHVGDLETKYALSIGGYSGNAGDSMVYHNDAKFTTFDMDSDEHSTKNCAVSYHGAWWYKSCYNSNLNGAWGATDDTGIKWEKVLGGTVEFSEMKMRLIK